MGPLEPHLKLMYMHMVVFVCIRSCGGCNNNHSVYQKKKDDYYKKVYGVH